MATIYNPRRGEHVTAHGHSADSSGGRTPTYYSWQNMHARCRYPSVPSFPNYGGRGITVCERWRDFSTFLADMGERPVGMTLDRIDADGNYEPGNCRWATKPQQQRNRRRCYTALTAESVAWIRSGTGLTHKQMAERLGVAANTVGAVLRGTSWQ